MRATAFWNPPWLAAIQRERDRAAAAEARVAALTQIAEAAMRMRARISRLDGKAWDLGRWQECADFDDALSAALDELVELHKQEET